MVLALSSGRRKERQQMAIGPVHMVVLGCNQPDFHGEVIAELEKLRRSDTVRVSPFDLVDIGLTTAAEVKSLHDLETAAVQ